VYQKPILFVFRDSGKLQIPSASFIPGRESNPIASRYETDKLIIRPLLLPPANTGSSLADFSTLKMEAIRSSETSVHTISTRRHIPEHGILH
jgi:hypothetical protein